MLRLAAAQAETLWDEALPIEVRQLPEDLAALDELLSDPALMAPFVKHWEREAALSGVSAAGHGRPTLAIETYVRLMVLKQRHGWGYRTVVAEVSDSIHLRRFCRIALSERVPDESTVRKLTRRSDTTTNRRGPQSSPMPPASQLPGRPSIDTRTHVRRAPG
jgi:IS5 family transposase